MDACDVVVVGGGPAGSACARDLRRRGLDVIVFDKARFPRDKVCAGWITPQVVEDLELDAQDYSRSRTFQTITAFRLGVIGRETAVDVSYDEIVSYGIRRCEFDEYLLRRSGARLRLGETVAQIDRRGGDWIVNGSVKAPVLVGAGGHRCPVARLTDPAPDRAPLVVATEVEYPVTPDDRVPGACAEISVSPDLAGYGWCVRKGQHMNVGFGRVGGRALLCEARSFVADARRRRRISMDDQPAWRAHAYLLSTSTHRRRFADGVLVVGDAAGLAQPASGEGIGPAVESGRLAAAAIIDAHGDYRAERLKGYDHHVQARLGGARAAEAAAAVFGSIATPLLLALVGIPWFARRVLLDAAFLRRNRPSLVHWHP